MDALELMAYLDGELPRERAAATAAHLEECRECQARAADLRGASQELASWQVDAPELEIGPRITVALEDYNRAQESNPKKYRARPRFLPRVHRAWLWSASGVVAVLLLVATFGVHRVMDFNSLEHDNGPSSYYQSSAPSSRPAPPAATAGYSESLKKTSPLSSVASEDTSADRIATLSQTTNGSLGRLERTPAAGKSRDLVLPTGPMVIHTAELSVVANDVDEARSKLEGILKRHHGYLGDLTTSGSADSARMLTATLQVPADQLDAAIGELKAMGRVESESQKGEEVSQQYVDLQARLGNARETEQTLLDILRRRTGKLSDVLEVEQEIASVRENIERMEAEKKSMEKQVAFSTVTMKVTEDYKQHVHMVPDSTSTRVRNAAVDGYETMVAGLINLLLFLVSAGPSILLWGAILFFPARWAWKKWQKRNRI